MILFARVAQQANDVRQTGTLSGPMIARASVSVCAQNVAHAILAILLESIPVKAWLANLTVGAIGIVEALETTSSMWIAVPSSA